MSQQTTASPGAKERALDPLDAARFWKPFRSNTLQRSDCLPFHADYPELLKSSEILAYLIRSYTVWEMTCGALGHPGGSFSEAEGAAVLFNYALRFDAKDPKWPMRDVFYLTKCHAAPALYTVLALYGYFPIQRLKYYGAWESGLESHPDCLVTPGIEVSGGSLGQIAGVAVGRALGIRNNGPDHNDRMVYALLGDGECNEGSVWEAAMAAHHYKLDMLTAFIDRNHMMIDGRTEDIMSLEPLAEKWKAFGWEVREIDGHDYARIGEAIEGAQATKGTPTVIICSTVKGKGVDFMEDQVKWHYGSIDSELAAKAKASITGGAS